LKKTRKMRTRKTVIIPRTLSRLPSVMFVRSCAVA
jgi:hypothetical protein